MAKGAGRELADRIRRGEENLADWDVEELLRGKRRNKAGNFSGKKPAWVPTEVHEELARRVQQDVSNELRAIVHDKAGPLIKKVLTGELDPEDVPGFNLQIKTIQDLLDRLVIGKQQNIEVKGTMTHEHIIQEVTIDRSLDDLGDAPELDDPNIVDAEVLDDEDWDD